MASRQQNSSSTSPRPSLSARISAVGAKINRALSSDAGRSSRTEYDAETQSIASTIVQDANRSTSRGRNYHSSGRGGAGNIHATAPSSNPTPAEPAQEFPWPRGRERAPVARVQAPTGVRSTGRGGAGNFSQSPPAADLSYSLRDREILRAHAESERNAVRSSGRGGVGNIVSPRSRSRSIDPVASPPGYLPNRDRPLGDVKVM
ncbi:hypothetical protein C8R47DRAFT_104980 [Mycena vitilis]|nr:hypothetical protein C8R47DRAFT_104980 [Mycena vitilis]